MDTAAVWLAVAEERVALADLLEVLEADAWDRPTLCGDWTVKDVVAHLVVLAEGTVRSVMLGGLRAGITPNRGIDRMARAAARTATGPQLAARLRAAKDGRFVVPGLPPQVALGEVLVHRSDLAEAAGLPALAANDRAREVLRAELKLWYAFGVARSARQARYRPTDGDWEAGTPGGPLVEAPAQTLLLAVTGRKPAIAACRGPGVALLTR